MFNICYVLELCKEAIPNLKVIHVPLKLIFRFSFWLAVGVCMGVFLLKLQLAMQLPLKSHIAGMAAFFR